MFRINIITQLLAFFIFAIMINFLKVKALLIALTVFVSALVWLKNRQFFQLLRRLKWFYLVMFLIYALNTPGEHFVNWPFSIGATHEGVQEGFAQLMRISVMLAALSLILTSNSRTMLMSGLYYLLFPLKLIGLNVECFTARLWLTLHYVETQKNTSKNINMFSKLGDNFSAIFEENGHEEVSITLEKPAYTWIDFGVMILLFGLLIYLMFKGLA
jgi:energy-coupling factor transporter transmembrane protein EcfT